MIHHIGMREIMDLSSEGRREPGLRSRYAENYYSTCVLDPDGHNIEAVCRL
jgi:hypothetical protein